MLEISGLTWACTVGLILALLVADLAVVTVMSLAKTRKDPSLKAHPGSIRRRRERERSQ